VAKNPISEVFCPWNSQPDENTPRSLAEAKKTGATRYWSETPCKYGHIGWRTTRNYSCQWCHRLISQKNRVAKSIKNKTERQEIPIIYREDHPIISRSAAREKGLSRYFTGIVCKRGHICERLVSSNTCMECTRILSREGYEKNPEVRKRADKKSRTKHPERVKQSLKNFHEKNPEYGPEYRLNYYENPIKRIESLVRSAISRSKKSGRDYDAEYLFNLAQTPSNACPCCNTPLDYTRRDIRPTEENQKGSWGLRKKYCPSLDRVDNDRGYVRDNVRVICMECNRLKSSHTLATLEMIKKFILQNTRIGE